MISTSEFRTGFTIELDGDVWQVMVIRACQTG